MEITNTLNRLNIPSKANQISDLVNTAETAINSPQDTTINVLSNKVENFVSDKESPKWIKKPLTYATGAVVMTLTYIATKKALKTPAKAMKFISNKLNNTEKGKALLTHFSNIKKNVVDFLKIEKIKTSDAVKYIKSIPNRAGAYINKNFPETYKATTDFINKHNLFKKSFKEYLSRVVSAGVAISSGKNLINKLQKINPENNNDITDKKYNLKNKNFQIVSAE